VPRAITAHEPVATPVRELTPEPAVRSAAKLTTRPAGRLTAISHLRERITGRMAIVAAAAAILAIVTATAIVLLTHDTSDKGEGTVAGAADTDHGIPGYKTLLPAGKTADELGGWKRVSPPDRNPVYAYSDTLGGIRIAVSQQPLPGSYMQNTIAAVADYAKAYGATSPLTAGDITAHIGTSAKGPQTVIFAKDGVLIRIKSDASIPTEDWSAYLTSLR